MTTERDEWLYAYTDTAQQAREFFGMPDDTPVRVARECIDGTYPRWAIKAPKKARS